MFLKMDLVWFLYVNDIGGFFFDVVVLLRGGMFEICMSFFVIDVLLFYIRLGFWLVVRRDIYFVIVEFNVSKIWLIIYL